MAQFLLTEFLGLPTLESIISGISPPKNTLFTVLDPRSRYKNDTVYFLIMMTVCRMGEMEHKAINMLIGAGYGPDSRGPCGLMLPY